MKLRYLDDELGGLILKHKAINKSELANKYNVDRHTIARHINKMEFIQQKPMTYFKNFSRMEMKPKN